MSELATKKQLCVLGLESSCDETAAAVILRDETGRGHILSNIVHSQLTEHAAFGGVVPEIAARAHVEVIDGLIEAAMADASLRFSELDGVAVTAGPGLIGGLMVGMMTAKSIALVHGLPLIGVNHLEGHALTPGLTDNLAPPYLLLLVSGGHTQLLIVRDIAHYQRLGTTVDDALGEAFDKTAKLLGLGYPGGPEVERWAKMGDPTRFALPRPMKGRPEPHFSFSGLKTALRQQALKLAPLSDRDIADLCASFQSAVIDTVADRVTLAMKIYDQQMGSDAPKTLVIAGGVAANDALRSALDEIVKAQDFSLIVPPASLCTDNAAMIGWAGLQALARGKFSPLDCSVHARWPLDPNAPPALGHS